MSNTIDATNVPLLFHYSNSLRGYIIIIVIVIVIRYHHICIARLLIYLPDCLTFNLIVFDSVYTATKRQKFLLFQEYSQVLGALVGARF